MSKDIFVVKRNGEKEKFNLKKIEKVVQWATENIENVSADEIIEHFQFNYTKDGISTKSIHSSVIECAINLITVDTPNYQFVAGRLFNYWIRKNIWGGKNPPRLIDLIRTNIKNGYYDSAILDNYTVKEINKINEFIDHDRDFNFPHSGIKQLVDKYLVQNRKTGEIVETPQFSYVLTAMILFSMENKIDRLDWIKTAYDAYSNFQINLATPVMAGARTPLRSYASCALFDVDDTLNSIGTHDFLFKKASASRYGLGFNISRMRPVNAPIRHGDVLHTGLVPYLKNFESGIKSCHQNGLRGASGTVHINFWHAQVETVLSLKNNALPDERAVRGLDYSFCINNLFLERVENNQEITLFNPDEVKHLIDTFGKPEWNALYEAAEQDESIKLKIKISAQDLMTTFAKERLGTGRIYMLNVDNANEHNPFLETILQSNLCQEVLQPVHASQKWNDENGLIGVCILSALNPLYIKDDEYEKVCAVAVRMLDNLIDYQSYFDVAAENFAKKYRSLGIGAFNFAAYLADNQVRYTDKEAPNVAARISEKISYYSIKASIQLAKERGKFEFFEKTKWKDGILPIDHYKKAIDKFVTEPLNEDWETLRADLLTYGIRNSTLTAYMPVESSSVITGSTSGLEPVRETIILKESRGNTTITVVPKLKENRDYYTLAFDMKNNDGILKFYAGINKFTDMGISANTYLNVNHYENKQIPYSVIVETIFKASMWGLKTLYYNNTEDAGGEQEQHISCSLGGCTL